MNLQKNVTFFESEREGGMKVFTKNHDLLPQIDDCAFEQISNC